MTSINKLGLRVAVVTFLALTIVYGAFWGVKKIFFTSPASRATPIPTETSRPTPLVENSASTEVDSDEDGIPDRFETIYRTDPLKADTDGDGTYDLNEISDGRDPLVAAPNDTLAPAVGSSITNPQTYTEKYLASLPDDVSRENILKQDSLELFIDKNKGELLSTISDDKIKIASETGKTAIKKYLDSISPESNKELATVTSDDITQAFTSQIANPQSLQDIVTKVENNVTLLSSIATPKETLDLHKQYIAASQALADNVTLLVNTKDDLVGGLIGAKKIEELGAIFQDIYSQILDLEKEYKL